jgi:hypothetical protein
MDDINNLIQIKDLERIEETPVIEVYRNPSSEDFWAAGYDNDAAWNGDIEGTGLIVYLYKGNRSWAKTSVSKTPFSYLKKSLANQSTYLTNVIVVRGTEDYPLTEKESKNLSALLLDRFKDTSVAGFSSYTTISAENDETQTILDNVIADLTTVISGFGYDLNKTENPEPASEINIEDLKSGSETVIVNGLKVTVQTKLNDDNDPNQGIAYTSVRVTNSEDVSVLYASTGIAKDA